MPLPKTQRKTPGLTTAVGLSDCPIRVSGWIKWLVRTESYPSDVTDAQWRLIKPDLPVFPGGRPRTTDLRDVVDAILYIFRTGCQWRYLPKDFPPKSTVWRYFDEWRHNGTLDTIHDLLRKKVRTAEKPYVPRTTASFDSQSVDTTFGGEQRGAGTTPRRSLAGSGLSSWTAWSYCWRSWSRRPASEGRAPPAGHLRGI